MAAINLNSQSIRVMKRLLLLISLFLVVNLTGCMDNSRSYKQRNRKVNTPEKLYDGIDLKVAQSIYDGDVVKLEKLIKMEGVNPNVINAKGETTFLSYSIMMEDLKVMKKLLELGADPDLASPNHLKTSTPISAASQRHNIKMLDLLFKYNVNPNPEIGSLPIDVALMGNNGKKTIEYLIAHGADVNLQGYIDGGTVIQTALDINKIKYMHYFLDKGANPKLINGNGRSFAFDVQEEINDGRLTKHGLKEYNRIKDRLVKEFGIEFPLKQEKRKGMEYRIERYESLTEKSKQNLGNVFHEVYEDLKDSLNVGVNGIGNPLDD